MIDRRVKLRHLQAFLEVAARRSVARAAEALHVSQPAISKTLRELEEITGAVLIERSRSGVHLTAAGEMFHHYAAAGIAALARGLDGLAQGGRVDTVMLRVGALPTVAARLAPTVVKRFREEDGGAVVSLETGPNGYLLEKLRAGGLDLVVGRLAAPDKMRDLSFTHLYSEPVVVVARPDHPALADPRPSLVEAVARYPVVAPPKDAVIRRTVDEMLAARGVGALVDRVESVSNAFGRAFVRQTDALWFISEGVVIDDLREGRLTLIAAPAAEATGPVGLTVRAGVDISPALRLFMRVAARAASDIADTPDTAD